MNLLISRFLLESCKIHALEASLISPVRLCDVEGLNIFGNSSQPSFSWTSSWSSPAKMNSNLILKKCIVAECT